MGLEPVGWAGVVARAAAGRDKHLRHASWQLASAMPAVPPNNQQQAAAAKEHETQAALGLLPSTPPHPAPRPAPHPHPPTHTLQLSTPIHKQTHLKSSSRKRGACSSAAAAHSRVIPLKCAMAS